MEQASLERKEIFKSAALVKGCSQGVGYCTTVNIDELLANLAKALRSNLSPYMHEAQTRDGRLFSGTEFTSIQLENGRSIEQCGDDKQRLLKRWVESEDLFLSKGQVFDLSIFEIQVFSPQPTSMLRRLVVKIDLREVALSMGVLPPPKVLLLPSGTGGSEEATGTASRMGGGASVCSKDASEQLSLWWLVALLGIGIGIGAVAIWAYRRES